MNIENFDYIKICHQELPKEGDTILVANEKNEIILTEYPYNGLMGVKILFIKEEELINMKKINF